MTEKEADSRPADNESKSESIIPGDTPAQEGASMGVRSSAQSCAAHRVI